MRKEALSDRETWLFIAAVSAALLLLIPLFILTGVRFSYTLRMVSAGGLLLGALSGVIGSFAVLRKQSLLGDALSHAALPGVGIAFLIAGRRLGVLLTGAAVSSLAGVWFISLITRNTRIKQDGAMGIVLAGWFAIGIGILAFVQQRPDASQAGLDSFIFGQAAAIRARDVSLLALVGGLMLLTLVMNWKEFKLVTFDPEFARANGYRVGLITAVLLALIVATVVLGLQLAGVVLMVGLLIAPGIAARQWTNRLEQMVVLAGVIGAASGGLGAVISALDAGLPTGPMIIITAFLFVLLSLLLAPGRGVLWNLLRLKNDQRRYAAANVRKTAYRYAMSHGDTAKPVSEDFLRGVLGRPAVEGIRQLVENDELRYTPAGYVLTGSGIELAMADEQLKGDS